MNKVYAVTAALVLLGLCSLAQADVFNLGAGYTNLDTVAVGDPGNTGELSGAGAGGYGPDRICGSVGYAYNIGKYEVTAGQYTAFLNAVAATDTYGLYNTNMDVVAAAYSDTQGCNIKRTGDSGSYTYSVATGWMNRPVNWVSYWDACRFANWLGNGQGNGDTETGAYTLNGYNDVDGRSIQRNAGWQWAVTSEDEWYKAAYYDPYKVGGAGYWLYPTGSNTAPGRDMADASGNNANCYGMPYPLDNGKYTSTAGEFQNSDSPYGTFDQAGNVWEWNEATVDPDSSRGFRGGGFGATASEHPIASLRYNTTDPMHEGGSIGFRVVMVPEPSSIIALAGGLVGILGVRRRRA